MKKGIWNLWLAVVVCLALVGSAFAEQIVAWGNNDYGQCDVPSGGNFAAIATGDYYSLALKCDGSLLAWGENARGQCDVPTGNDFVAIAAGYKHNLAIKSDGSLVAWGGNYNGQCNVPAGKNFADIAAGAYHSLALKADGSLAAWGNNYYGQCNVPPGNDFVAIACGDFHSFTLKSDGSLVAWGYNIYGQCNVPPGNDFTAIAAGSDTSLAIRSDGSLAAWGLDSDGCVSNLPPGNDFVAITVGGRHSLALKSDGSLVAWGYNRYGQCNMPTGNDVIAIAAGKYHSLALVSSLIIEIEILGPEMVTEHSSTQYIAIAYYDGGYTADVTTLAIWSLESDAYATIDQNGVLATKGIDTPEEDITIYAEYTEYIECGATVGVTVNDQITVWLSPLVDLEIIGPEQVLESSQIQYEATAHYANGSIKDVTDSALWWVEPNSVANIQGGLLRTNDIYGPQNITIYAEYAESKVTVEAELAVQVILRRTLYVPTDYETIQAAIDACVDGDVVIVTPGTYTGPGNRNINFKRKAITVRSESGPKNCVIDCDGTETEPHRGFYFHSGEDANSILDGFTIINGYVTAGGAIYCSGSSPTLINCIFRNNSAREYGGAIYSKYNSSPKLINCAFIGNTARTYGGGMYSYIDGNPTLVNCTFSGNWAYWGGGGMFNGMGISSSLTNCIFWGNRTESGAGHQILLTLECVLSISYCDIQGGRSAIYVVDSSINWGDGNILANPWLAPDGYHLSERSPCINAGTNSPAGGLPATDIDGAPRVLAGRVDMGADEFTDEVAELVELEITGPGEVAEDSSAQYTAIAYYDLGYSAEVTTPAIWSLESDEYATINHYGRLTTGRIEPSGTITIYAQYTEAGVTTEAEMMVQVSSLVDLEMTGPKEVRGSCQEQYNLIAYYGNGHTSDVTDSALWRVEPEAIANIEAGLLCTDDIDELQNITIYAQYTSGGVTLEGEMTIQGFPPPPYTFYVPADYQTIQEAINFAEDSDTVIVAPGTYTGEGNRDIDFYGLAITVRSIDPNDPNIVATTIIDCNGTGTEAHRGFYFHSGEDVNCVLSGFTITNGYADSGGGIYCLDSSPTITNCTISGNLVDGRSARGGGIYCEDSNPTISNCTISGNSVNGRSARGGGIYCEGGTPSITNCTITSNSVDGEWASGGGISCSGGNTTINNCTISGNSVSGTYALGGGMYNDESSPTVTNCTFSGNSVNGTYALGGGIYCGGSSPTITNCTISGNLVNGTRAFGGGIYSEYSSPTITNCTFSGNSVNGTYALGGGIYCRDSSQITIINCTITDNSVDGEWAFGRGIFCGGRAGSSATITNCIVWDGGNEIWNDDGSAIIITYSDVQGGWPGEGNIDDDPCFVEPGYWDMNDVWVEGDYHLQLTSPCIDAANDAGVYTDIEDNIRPFDFPGVDNNGELPEFDMGAYEAMVSCFGVNYVKLETKAGKKGNKVELKGTFSPALPIDFAKDDVIYIIDDGQGHMLSFIIPADSFEPEGKPEKQKFKFDSPKHSQPDIKAKFDFLKCKFELEVKGVMDTSEITGETLAIVLQAGENPANLVEEFVQVQAEPKRLEYKREPKLSCCPKCKGIALLEVTSTDPFTGDEYVLLFEPEPGKEKLKRKTVVDDGVNGRVKIDTSCSKPFEVGDVFGAYTVTDLIKIFDDWPDDDNDE